MFECHKCGCCCKNIANNPIYADLDDGNGVCRYLHDNLCSIYEKRPLKCRVDDCYEKFFSEDFSREEYYELNHKACDALKAMQDSAE